MKSQLGLKIYSTSSMVEVINEPITMQRRIGELMLQSGLMTEDDYVRQQNALAELDRIYANRRQIMEVFEALGGRVYLATGGDESDFNGVWFYVAIINNKVFPFEGGEDLVDILLRRIDQSGSVVTKFNERWRYAQLNQRYEEN